MSQRGENLPDGIIQQGSSYFEIEELSKEERDEYLKIKKVTLLSKIEKHLKTIKTIILICFFGGVAAAFIWLIVYLATLG